MKYAIIAGGKGERLRADGFSQAKPLVNIGNECLIDRLLRLFQANGADEIVVFINGAEPSIEAHLQAQCVNGCLKGGARLTMVTAVSPSPVYSLLLLKDHLQGQPFVLSTVDTVFKASNFAAYIEKVKESWQTGDEGVMAVTTYIADTDPLYVAIDATQHILDFCDHTPHIPTVSAGIYALPSTAIDVLQRCYDRGERRMRAFQRALLQEGVVLKACDIGKVVDVDCGNDVAEAQKLVQNEYIVAG